MKQVIFTLILFLPIRPLAASVTVVWRENASGVEAQYFGQINTSLLTGSTSLQTEPAGATRNNLSFAHFSGGSVLRIQVPTATTIRLIPDPRPAVGNGSGDSFGFSPSGLFFNPDYQSNSPIEGSAFFPGRALTDLFPVERFEDDLILAELINQRTTVYLDPVSGEQVDYLVIPEPHTPILLSLIPLGHFLQKRRRSRP